MDDSHNFETQLIEEVMEFLKHESSREEFSVTGQSAFRTRDLMTTGNEADGGRTGRRRKLGLWNSGSNDEVRELMEAKEAGAAYMMANTYVIATETSSLLKKFAINIVYAFLRRNSRRPAIALRVPHTSLIEVGMVYRV